MCGWGKEEKAIFQNVAIVFNITINIHKKIVA
jgi:hypothetical protein